MFHWSLVVLGLVGLCCLVEVHGEEDWEWVGLFEVTSTSTTKYTFELRNVGEEEDHEHLEEGEEEDHEDFHALFFVTSAIGSDEDALEAAEEVAETHFDAALASNSTVSRSGAQLTLNIDEVYELSYSNESWVTLITINFPSDGFYALFTGHHPAELCGSDDYTSCFRDQHGQVVSILLEEEHHDHDHEEEHHEEGRSNGTKWLYTLLGCGLCWLVVFSGLIFMVCGSQKYDELTRRHLNLLNLFASGAILATVLFLIVIESYHFLEAVGMEEGETAAVFGTCILGGFISPTLIELIVFRDDIEPNDILSSRVVEMVEEVKKKPVMVQANVEDKVVAVEGNEQVDLSTFEEKKCEAVSNTITEKNEAPNPIALEESSPTTTWKFDRIVISVICGDFLHNFCDGIFIGVAVRSCSLSLMWTIILVTMFHEFAQEISDFVILTTKVGLSVPHALTLNAIGGFSVILGGIFTNLFDLSDLVIGAFLAYGSGNLVYLSAAELFPLLHISSNVKAKVTSVDKLQGLLCFCVGAFVIGLTLLRHEHCEADGDAHDH